MKRCCPNPNCQYLCPEYAINCPLCGTPLRVGFVPPQQFEHVDHNPMWEYNMFTHVSTCRKCGKTKFGMP